MTDQKLKHTVLRIFKMHSRQWSDC